jgi:hypothetical protein
VGVNTGGVGQGSGFFSGEVELMDLAVVRVNEVLQIGGEVGVVKVEIAVLAFGVNGDQRGGEEEKMEAHVW